MWKGTTDRVGLAVKTAPFGEDNHFNNRIVLYQLYGRLDVIHSTGFDLSRDIQCLSKTSITDVRNNGIEI